MKKVTSVLLSVAMLLTMAVMFSGCGGPSEKAIYPKSIKVEGTNGHGVIAERLSTDLVSEKRRMTEKAANRDLYVHYKSLKKVYNDCVVTVVDGENKNLSNGDTVTIKITSDRGYDKDMLEQLGISEDELSFEEFKYEVQGLNEPQEVEAKKDDIDIEFSGYSGEGRASVKYNNSDNAINYKLSSEDNLSNGDKVTVTPSISETNDTYVLKNPKEKFEFTVSGLPEFSDSLDGIDTSEVDKLMDEFVSKKYFGAFDVGDDIGRTVMSEYDIEKYPYDQIPIIKYDQSKLDDNTKKYYKFQRSDRAIYSKKLTVSYTAKADEDKIIAKKGDIVKGSERVIIYANVVTVDGKLHLVNPNYGGSDSKPYLTDYKVESDTPIPYDFDHNVIDEIREDSYNTIDQDYNEFIQNNDVGDNNSYVY